MRFAAPIKVERGIDEELKDRHGAPGLARQKANRRGEVAPRAVAGDAHARGIPAECGSILRDPTKARPRVVDGGGEPVLRSAAIIDGDDDAVTVAGQAAAGDVVGVEIAEQESTAMKER